MAEEYKSYKDGNGVTWTVIQGATSLAAYVADDASPLYVPPAKDVLTMVLLGKDQNDAEAVRQSFIRLRELIQEYAESHKTNVALQVTATPSSGIGWLVVALIAAAMMD